MKKLILTLLTILTAIVGYTQSINGKAISNWDECVSLSQTEFKHTCLGDDREKSWLSAHTTITNNCDQRISVTVKFQGSLKNGESSRNRTRNIKPNSSAKIYECHAIRNQGSWQIISVQSADRSYTSSTTNSSSGKNDRSYHNSNSSTVSVESIYEKRRKEAEAIAVEKEKREKAKEKREQAREEENRRQYQALQRKLRNQEEQAQRNYNKAVKDYNDVVTGMARARERKRQFDEEEDRKAEERKRQRKLRIEEEERREAEAYRRKTKIASAKRQFINDLKDAKIPLSYSNSAAYFIMIVKSDKEEIRFSKFTLFKNSSNQLPYKQDVLNKFKKQTYQNELFVQGPFDSKTEQEREYQNIKEYARLSHINIGSYISFKYNSPTTSEVKTSDTDFWGNSKKKKTTKKTKRKSDFWN